MLSILRINFDVPFPSVQWNDTSGVPLNTVSKHYLIEHLEKMEDDFEKTKKVDLSIIENKKIYLDKLKKYIEKLN